MKILVVEDDPDSGEALTLLLSEVGHEVRWARNAHRALSLASEFEPQIAILDIGLPVLSGYDLIARLRTLPGLVDCRYFAVTAYSGREFAERSRLAGFEQHMVKPLHWAALLANLPQAVPQVD